MLHEAVYRLVWLAAPVAGSSTSSPSSAGDHTVQVAIVTALGVVLAATVTAVASTFQRSRSSQATAAANDNYNRAYINGLLRDQRELRTLQHKHVKLREACARRGLDPDELIREQP